MKSEIEHLQKSFRGTKAESYSIIIDSYVLMYLNEELSYNELTELMEDTVRSIEIDALVDDMELKTNFIKSVDMISKLL